jgi:hypothetical protein
MLENENESGFGEESGGIGEIAGEEEIRGVVHPGRSGGVGEGEREGGAVADRSGWVEGLPESSGRTGAGFVQKSKGFLILLGKWDQGFGDRAERGEEGEG